MSVLVTGGAGYIGSHMVLGLLDRGERVVVVDDLSTGFEWAVPPAAAFVKGDVGDEALMRGVIEAHAVEAVVHFAGSIVVPDSLVDPLGYYLNNTVKSRSLIGSCVKAGVARFIFSSTAAVYGIPESNPVYEEAPLRPISPYGSSKLMTEWMLEDCARAYGLSQVALRYFNVAGADAKGRAGQSTAKATHLIKVASQVALGQRPRLEIFGRDYATPDGTCVRDYIHVSDLIAAHLAALDHLRKGGKGGAFNCGYGRGYSVLDVVRAVERAVGHPLAVKDMPRRAGDPPMLVAGAEKVRTHLGWTPRHDDLDFIVRTALAWEDRLARRSAA
jgi:UDP-glucose 4-epimerase